MSSFAPIGTHALIAILLVGCTASAPSEYSEAELATALAIVAAERTRTAASASPGAPTTQTPIAANGEAISPEPNQLAPTDPHGDGIYRVGAEIAAGRWRSTSSERRFCYWARRKYDGIILGSYYGLPGGELRVEPGDYEVELDGCGVWIYQGD